MIDSLQDILKAAKEDTSRVNILNELSKRLWRTANAWQGMNYAEEALNLAKRINFIRGISDAYNMIGAHHEYQGTYAEALKYHFNALKLAEELKDTSRIIWCYRLIGAAYEEQGSDLPDISLRKNALNVALKYDSAALRMAEDIGDKRQIADSYNSIGVVYSDQGNQEEALKNYLRGLKIVKELNIKRYIIVFSSNIADVYRSRGEYSNALEINFNLIKIANEIEDRRDLSSIYLSIGTCYFSLKENRKARQFYNKGLTVAKEVGDKSFIASGYKQMAGLDSTEGNWNAAYQNYKLMILYRDSLNNEKNTEKFELAQMQYLFNKKADSLSQKQLLTEVKLTAQTKQKYFYLAGAILLALLSVFIFLNFRNQRKANRLSNIVHAKEKAELELHSLRAQLNPHFMFNSLNAIQELILREDFDNSHTYLARFAKLLRMLVENAEKPFVSLNTELEFLELYLSLEKLRIPNLSSSITTDSSIDKTKTLIPNMVLQPYIENALWHGLSQKNGEKKLELNIHKQNGIVLYEVKDNGVGRKKAAEFKSSYRKEHKSKGMELLTKRFKLLSEEFGSEIKTNICDVMTNGEVEGTLVSITVPNSISAI